MTESQLQEQSSQYRQPQWSCRRCCFWFKFTSTFPQGNDSPTGQCRRYPPVIVTPFEMHDVLPAESGFWPLTRPDDWCGEYQPREGPS